LKDAGVMRFKHDDFGTARQGFPRCPNLKQVGERLRSSPHYSREMRGQSQAVDIVHNYANGLFDEVFCNEIFGPGVWWPGPISGGPMNYSG